MLKNGTWARKQQNNKMVHSYLLVKNERWYGS